MSDLMPHVRTLFKSKLLHVLDYRCAGHNDVQAEIPEGYEIVLTRAGAYQRKDAHGTFLADPNHVLFYNQGQPYDITHPVQGGDSSTVFTLAPALLIEMMRNYDPDIENGCAKIFQRSHITLATRLHILQYRLLHTNKSRIDPLEMEEQIITAVAEIIDALYRGHQARAMSASRETSRLHADQTQAVKTYVNAHIRSRLGLEQISSAVHLSPYHLCRLFKCDTGMSIHQYVKRLRLFNAAERMLEIPMTRLDALALDYGFSNHGHFSTVFRGTFGLSPSDFRDERFRQMSKILKA
jgi:AraC family transcriptional regulator